MATRGAGRADAGTIYDELRADVRAGRLGAGEPVREVAVAERFGVSRTPVREALRRLQHDRVLIASARGLAVREIEPEEVIATYDVRILLEGEAAAEAARRRTESDLLRLQALLERDRALVAPDDETRTTTNMAFHEAVWAATHNTVLVDLLGRLTLHLVRVPHSTLSVEGRWEGALDEHAALLDAVTAQDAEQARGLAADHMRAAREVRLRLLREHAVRAPAS